MASVGTPLALYSTYRNIKVCLLGHQIILAIDVHEYRNNELGGSYSTAAGVAEFFKLKEKIKVYGNSLGHNLYEIYYPLLKAKDRKKNPQTAIDDFMLIDIGLPLYNVFVGKGSPKEIADVLKLAVAFGFVEPGFRSMQTYCDKNIGIDCSGFAANYFGLTPKEICNTGASRMAPTAKRITRLEDVRVGTAIVFKSGQHVALVDQITNTAEHWASASCSCGCSRFHDQSIAPRNVDWRALASRRAPPSRSKRRGSRSSSFAALNTPMRAAASSMASGMPSSSLTISPTADASASLNA